MRFKIKFPVFNFFLNQFKQQNTVKDLYFILRKKRKEDEILVKFHPKY